MLNHNTEVTGPAIGVDVSGFDSDNSGMTQMGRTPGKTKYIAGCGSLAAITLNGALAALGMPSLESIVDGTINNPNNYSTYVDGVTFKGKDRTFKNKVSRKRILHKDRRLDEFKIAMNSMRRWM